MEHYCHDMQNALKAADEFEGNSKEKIEKAIHEVKIWIQGNQLATQEDFEEEKEDLEGVVKNEIRRWEYGAMKRLEGC